MMLVKREVLPLLPILLCLADYTWAGCKDNETLGVVLEQRVTQKLSMSEHIDSDIKRTTYFNGKGESFKHEKGVFKAMQVSDDAQVSWKDEPLEVKEWRKEDAVYVWKVGLNNYKKRRSHSGFAKPTTDIPLSLDKALPVDSVLILGQPRPCIKSTSNLGWTVCSVKIFGNSHAIFSEHKLSEHAWHKEQPTLLQEKCIRNDLFATPDLN